MLRLSGMLSVDSAASTYFWTCFAVERPPPSHLNLYNLKQVHTFAGKPLKEPPPGLVESCAERRLLVFEGLIVQGEAACEQGSVVQRGGSVEVKQGQLNCHFRPNPPSTVDVC